MHRPVDPIETKVGEYNTHEYLDYASKPAKSREGKLSAQ